MNDNLDLYESEALYKACKRFCDTWKFGKECSNRKGMYCFVEGIEEDLKWNVEDIIKEIGIHSCPFLNKEE